VNAKPWTVPITPPKSGWSFLCVRGCPLLAFKFGTWSFASASATLEFGFDSQLMAEQKFTLGTDNGSFISWPSPNATAGVNASFASIIVLTRFRVTVEFLSLAVEAGCSSWWCPSLGKAPLVTPPPEFTNALIYLSVAGWWKYWFRPQHRGQRVSLRVYLGW